MIFNKKIKLAAIITAFAALGVAFVGCGGEKAAKTDDKAVAGGKTTVKLVLSSTERPLSWADESGKLQGYEYDIWQEVNKNLTSFNLDIQAVPPETQDVMMESGNAKVSSGGYYKTAQREKDFIVPSTPIGVSSLMVYMTKENAAKYKNLMDIAKAGLKMVPNTPNGGVYKVLMDWNEKNGKPFAEIPIQDGLSPAERVNMLATGQYDALIYPNNIGVEDVAKITNFDMVALTEPIVTNPTVIIVNKNEKKLAEEIEAAMKKLKDDGTLAKISEKWYHADLFQQLK